MSYIILKPFRIQGKNYYADEIHPKESIEEGLISLLLMEGRIREETTEEKAAAEKQLAEKKAAVKKAAAMRAAAEKAGAEIDAAEKALGEKAAEVPLVLEETREERREPGIEPVESKNGWSLDVKEEQAEIGESEKKKKRLKAVAV